MLMKLKIFVGNELGTLENQINEWLQKEGITQIHHVTHANNVGKMFITVWWDTQRAGK